MPTKEKWKIIREYPLYWVSDQGRIKSFNHNSKGRIIKPWKKDGYLRVRLSDRHGKTQDAYIHRLVAQYFCEGYVRDKDVHHLNRDRTDNRACNLQPLTKSEHAKKHQEERKREEDEQ